MRLLLFGRTGQIGAALARVLGPNHQLVALGRDEADFAYPDTLADFVRKERPDVIINAVAYTSVDRAESEPELARLINTESPAALAQAAAETGAWMVHYSTDYVFDGDKEGAYAESDATNPLNHYGRTKRDGDLAVGAAGGPHLILRTSWVHAPGHANFVATILGLAAKRKTLGVVDDQIGAPTSARLVATVTASLIDAIGAGKPPESGIYHLAARGETSWCGYARFIVALALEQGARLELRPEHIQPIPSAGYPQPARRPLNSRLSTKKLDALGIQLPDWRDDVRDTIRLSLPEAVQ